MFTDYTSYKMMLDHCGDLLYFMRDVAPESKGLPKVYHVRFRR